MLTFNPGWNQATQNVDKFTDIRELRDELSRRGIHPVNDEVPGKDGPGSIIIEDPDGNPF